MSPDATAFAHLVDDGGFPRAVQRFLRGWRASSSRDVELPVEPGRDALLAEISRNARFDRHRVLRSLDEPELRRIAHRLELPEAIDDIDEDELRAVIARCFELTVDAR